MVMLLGLLYFQIWFICFAYKVVLSWGMKVKDDIFPGPKVST